MFSLRSNVKQCIEATGHYWWIHDKDHPMHLNGRTVVVTGDVSNANIHVNGNVTFEGNLRNVSVTAITTGP